MDKKDVLKKIKDEEVAYVDIRFTDPRGKLQHVTVMCGPGRRGFPRRGLHVRRLVDRRLEVDRPVRHEADARPSSAYMDPFYAEKTLAVHCTVLEPDTNEPYERDPRGTAVKAEAYLKSTGIADAAYMGPEAEFFIFDDVRYSVTMNKVSFQVDALDAAWNTDTEYEMGNMGHRPGVKGGYFPVGPVDDAQDLRSEMLSTMKRIGMKVDKHHHEVASCQHELGLIFSTLTDQADQIQKYKYVIHRSPRPTASRPPSCPSPSRATTARGCTSTCRSGRTASRSSRATSTPTFRRRRCTTSAAS
jgi:glutamine synthetase